jgi:phosphoribosylanthranilate isomerase
MIKVKICGITRAADAEAICGMGVDFMGLVFAPSERRVSEKTAAEIIDATPGFENWVGVFVDEPVESIARIGRHLRLSFIQLHGSETAGDCRELALRGFQVIKALRVREPLTVRQADLYPCPYILLDSYSPVSPGGTGHCFEWSYLKENSLAQKLILSGGLNATNVADLLRRFSPHGVDVSSGVEKKPGIKDPVKVESFLAAVRKAEGASRER